MKSFIHRALFLFFLVNCYAQSANACFCITTNYCSYVDYYNDDPTLLAFKGSFIQSVSVSDHIEAYQFKVEEVYKGEIVTPDSPYYDGEEYTNTDSTVWVLSGYEETCMRGISPEDAIFVVPYKTGLPNSSESFGYVPSICNADYFPISEDKTITGPIWESGEDVTIQLPEFVNILEQDCSDITHVNDNLEKGPFINIYPQPTTDFLNIEISNTTVHWSIELYNNMGQRLRSIQDKKADISDLGRGIYYVVLSQEGDKKRYYKKVLKI